ncbi:MAG: TonB-dependent receptor [Acidobacteria bacterium]|nr:TonB-dependent receptor [Acidobacteriota bacterium]
MLVALIAAAPVQAQETGTVRGTVTLVENGEPVDGAVILILGTGAFTFTDDGTFEFTDVPTGEYVVSAQREHLTTVQQPVTVAAGETASVEFSLSLSPVREEVTVTAEATLGAEATLQAFNAVTTLDSFDIAIEAPSSLGEALEDEPGIANRSFGPGSSRPIVRGFSGDRVHIIEDGIPTGDLSSTSDHHGVTIDPHNAERIEITRGPATLLYGSNIVGLINVITPHAAYRNTATCCSTARGEGWAPMPRALTDRSVRTPTCSIPAATCFTGAAAPIARRATTKRRRGASSTRPPSCRAAAPGSAISATASSRASA